ncbi:hypothetical protein GCM10010339_10720 [Streptomyces alanosinicus]|uniref:Uncharacterized protein n=1 Tax=Streptomyces alanosinicus TaxID=68171 RepID=A0A918YDC1_9ACTN|nr:hypothetical protein GCM10010339_10720 [Streptomyces alanosinicus]
MIARPVQEWDRRLSVTRSCVWPHDDGVDQLSTQGDIMDVRHSGGFLRGDGSLCGQSELTGSRR